MSSYKEIVTKAVIGKGKKTSTSTFVISPAEKVDTVLGCWVINHNFKGTNRGNQVTVTGSFDVNVWYSFNNDTKTAVVTKSFSYDEKTNVNLKENSDLSNNPEIIVRSLKQPTVTDVSVEDNGINMKIEKELGIEIVGDQKMKIVVEDSEDDYEILEDISTEEKVIESIDTEIKEDYIE